MQLNSITIMDLIAYGGAALGVIMAVTQYQSGGVSLEGCLLIILLAADFFIPMRQLGSFFHIAMNGMAASDKIFRLLDLEETKPEITESFPSGHTIRCSGLSFSYEPDREILHSVDLTDSTSPKLSPAVTLSPSAGRLIKTTSPSASWAKSEMPITATSPSILTHSWDLEYFSSAGMFMVISSSKLFSVNVVCD